jgi:hypothetical protein
VNFHKFRILEGNGYIYFNKKFEGGHAGFVRTRKGGEASLL